MILFRGLFKTSNICHRMLKLNHLNYERNGNEQICLILLACYIMSKETVDICHKLTPWSPILLEKPTVIQPLKNFPFH
jgi:hypothetical protein